MSRDYRRHIIFKFRLEKVSPSWNAVFEAIVSKPIRSFLWLYYDKNEAPLGDSHVSHLQLLFRRAAIVAFQDA